MTLDEAIRHAREMAAREGGSACGSEHEQLASWLEDLVEAQDREARLLAIIRHYRRRRDEREEEWRQAVKRMS